MRHVLDDPAWHALIGPLASFAEGAGAVRRISPAHSVFTGVDPSADPVVAARDLRAMVAPGGRFVVVGRAPVLPPGFDEVGRGRARQMVLEDAGALRRVAAAATARNAHEGRPVEVVVLGAGDVADMLALVDHARPGPFLVRTIELGNYFGVRVDGALVAMAGERLRPPGHVEISAVSTHDAHRRRGLASIVVHAVAQYATARGDLPFLHVVETNVSAIAVYERLGFRTRTMVDFVAGQRPVAEGP